MANIIDRTKNKIPTLDKAGLGEMRTAISVANLTLALKSELYGLCDDRETQLNKVASAFVVQDNTASA